MQTLVATDHRLFQDLFLFGAVVAPQQAAGAIEGCL
jgi:hypothetical protein